MALLEEENILQDIKQNCPEIPILVNYAIDPPDSFWENSPQHHYLQFWKPLWIELRFMT
jgi:hypothetical protein